MNDFFKGFEIPKTETRLPKEDAYPGWVLQSLHPELISAVYDIVEKLYLEGKSLISTRKYRIVSDVLLSQSQVCKRAGKHRNALQNHPLVIEHINKRNAELRSLIDSAKAPKSLARKTKNQIKSERDAYGSQLHELSKSQLEILLKSELLVNQADALQQIADLKQRNSELRTEVAALKSANQELQARIRARATPIRR